MLLMVIFSAMTMSVYAGRITGRVNTFWLRGNGSVITACAITMSGLLIIAVFSASFIGFVSRVQSEVNEAQSVAKAWGYAALLPAEAEKKMQNMLKKYLDDRIHFFRDETTTGEYGWLRMAEDLQQQQWKLLVSEASQGHVQEMTSVLSACNALMISMMQTEAVWRRQIPDSVWFVLIMFVISAGFLTGRLMPGRDGGHFYLLLFPVMTSLLLFIIAEIDIPGQGLIRVTPDDLEQLGESLVVDHHDMFPHIYHVRR